MGKAIQFYGSATMLQAFDARGLTVWAIFQDRTMCVAGEGREQLEKYIEMLGSNTIPVYTLKVYKDVDADDVTDKTGAHGSFNFKLDSDGSAVSGKSGNSGAIGKVLQRIEEMESGYLLEYLDRLEERRENRSSNKIDVIGAVNNLISDPAQLVQVVGLIKNLFSGNSGAQAMGISSIAPPSHQPQAMPDESLESKIGRLQAAINILEQTDPDLVAHLEKLAKLSQQNPQLFAMVLTQLDNMIK